MFLSRPRGCGSGGERQPGLARARPVTQDPQEPLVQGQCSRSRSQVLPPDLRSEAVLRCDVPCQELGVLTLTPPGGWPGSWNGM